MCEAQREEELKVSNSHHLVYNSKSLSMQSPTSSHPCFRVSLNPVLPPLGGVVGSSVLHNQGYMTGRLICSHAHC